MSFRACYTLLDISIHKTLALALFICPFISNTIHEAKACGWHYENIRAEAKSLPCTRNVVVNAWPS